MRIRLGDYCKTNNNNFSVKRDNWKTVNYLETGNITRNKIENIQFIDLTTEKLPSRAKRMVNYNSIIYSTVRPIQRHYGIIKKKLENFLVSTGFVVIDVDKNYLDANYIYYFLTQDEYVEKLQAIAEQSTSAYPSIKPSDIDDLEIDVPEIEAQRKIARVLKVIDKKIENNNMINDNLAA